MVRNLRGRWRILSRHPAGDYSGFDSALYRRLAAEWHFSQENGTPHDLDMATCESKPLWNSEAVQETMVGAGVDWAAWASWRSFVALR
jgi:hypothetical protein